MVPFLFCTRQLRPFWFFLTFYGNFGLFLCCIHQADCTVRVYCPENQFFLSVNRSRLSCSRSKRFVVWCGIDHVVVVEYSCLIQENNPINLDSIPSFFSHQLHSNDVIIFFVQRTLFGCHDLSFIQSKCRGFQYFPITSSIVFIWHESCGCQIGIYRSRWTC